MRRWLLCGLLGLGMVPPQSGCTAHAHEGKLHVAIVGDKYTEADHARFDQDAAKITAALLTFSPYSEYAESIAFQPVWNLTPLDCKHSATMTRLITCSSSKASAAVNAAGIEYDHIIVVVKDGSYGGSGGSLTVTYNGSSMVEVVKHEFGHTFGGLMDEYLLSSSNGTVQNRLQANIYLAPIVPVTIPGKWVPKGNRPNWSKQKVIRADGSTTSSLMEALGKPHNEVSKARIRERLALHQASE